MTDGSSERGQAYRGIAQLVERRSPKPQVGGSSPSAPAISTGQRGRLAATVADGVAAFGCHNSLKVRLPLVKKGIGLYVGQNRHAVRGAESSALRAVMAWIFNGIENESDCVSAAGTLRDGESDLALAARDDDLDRHGVHHGFPGCGVLLRCGPAYGLADRPRPQRWRLIGWR